MSRLQNTQFNVRSAFAHKRAHELAKLTGMTATEVVEDALRGYVPPAKTAKVHGLIQRGPILVLPAGKSKIKIREANAALQAARERDV
jgi:hypothetical protein